MKDATTKGSMAPNTGQQRDVAATVVQGGKVHTKMLVKEWCYHPQGADFIYMTNVSLKKSWNIEPKIYQSQAMCFNPYKEGKF